MDDKEKSVIIGVSSVIYSVLWIIFSLFWISAGILTKEYDQLAPLFMLSHGPLLASGLIGLILKKYWKIQLKIFILTIIILIAFIFL